MNILLTGGAGYIGSHTAVVLSQSGHQITLFDNLSNSQKNVVNKLHTITGLEINFIEGDVRDTQLLSDILKKHAIEAVIHFAGLKAVGDSVKNPIDYYSVNVQGSISLITAMKFQNVKKLVFSSSATVYGVPQYLPYDEDHPTSAINPYGRTKLYVEEILKDISLSDAEWAIASLRYFNPIGAHESAIIGELPSGIPNNLMPYIVKVASGQLEMLSVFGNDYPTKDGTGERDYIHVMDLADGHLAALKYIDSQNGFHTINLGTGNSTSVLDLVHTFEKVTSQEIHLKMAPRRPGDLPSYYALPSKAKELLGWKAKRTIDEMCLSAWRWEKSRNQ